MKTWNLRKTLRTPSHTALAAALLLLVGANKASAHANAIGYTAGANAGEVNLWLGAWHFNGHGDGNDLEGSANLFGLTAPYNVTTPFTYSTPGPNAAPQPAGLVAGTNLFYSPGEGASDVFSWEAVTISGLSAGQYVFTYVPIANPTAHWTPAPGLQGITLTLTAGDVGGGGSNVSNTPDGGSSVLMLGFGFLGIAAIRRKLS